MNRDNPLPGLTLAQVDAIFSKTRRCGVPASIDRWGQLGLGGEWEQREVALFGRNLLSGTRAFFAEHALCKGEFKDRLQMRPTSVDVVSAVSWQTYAIGYSGVGYARPTVRVLPIAAADGQAFVEATPANARMQEYPLTRFLYIYVNKRPGQPLPRLEREFLRFVLSERGQYLVENDGFIPLSPDTVSFELAKLD